MSATTIRLFDGKTATENGPQKRASVPVPSAKEAVPLPASVVTAPPGVMSRMRLLM